MESVKNKSFFKRFFPAPEFLTMPAVGVDISDSSIHFIKLLDKQEGKIPIKFGSCHISDGIISKGEIQDVKALSEALKKLKKEQDIDFVRASLSEEKAYLFQTQIPDNMEDKDIRNILEFKLEEYVPMSPSEAIFDYEALPERKDHLNHIDVEVAVYPKQTIEKYTSAFHEAGLIPLSFEIEAQAIARAVIRKGDDGTYMIIDFGKTKTGLSIVSGGILNFTSTIEAEKDKLSDAIIKHLSVSEKEVDNIKNEEGLIKTKNNKELFAALSGVAESLKDDIDKHYRYWKTRLDEKGNHVSPIEKIILCGGNSNLAGLPEFLSGSLMIPVERANVWTNTFSFDDFIPEIRRSKSFSYATAIGLALRDLK